MNAIEPIDRRYQPSGARRPPVGFSGRRRRDKPSACSWRSSPISYPLRPALRRLARGDPRRCCEGGGIAAGAEAAAAMIAARAGDGRGDPSWCRSALRPASGGRRPLFCSIRHRGCASCARSSSRAWTCSARTVRTRSRAPRTPRTSMSQASPGLLRARSALPIRQMRRGSGRRTGRASSTASMNTLAADPQRGQHRRPRPSLCDGELAMADGAIACWEDKYHWRFWRPVTAIREAANDGNPATDPDPDWTPHRDPAIPRSSICAWVHERGARAHAAELLRHRQGRLQRLQRELANDQELRSTLRRDQGDHRRPRLGASTSGRQTSRVPSLARRSRTTCRNTTSAPVIRRRWEGPRRGPSRDPSRCHDDRRICAA